jgi:hypothetical protein
MDEMDGRLTVEAYHFMMKSAQDANYNTLRVRACVHAMMRAVTAIGHRHLLLSLDLRLMELAAARLCVALASSLFRSVW